LLLPLLMVYCVVNWAVGCVDGGRRRGRWRLGVAFNLLVLAYWKYTPLVLRSFTSVPVPDDWAIPFGISFYAFTGIAYMVDVYRGTTPAERSLWRYTLSAVFFPHLVAGPILRPDEFLTRLRPETMPAAAEAPLEAAMLLARGFFKKMVLADRIAAGIDPFFVHVAGPSTAGVGHCPTSTCTHCRSTLTSPATPTWRAAGAAVRLPLAGELQSAVLAGSVQEFWHRWHMTLSRFLKDYLYIPLGGSRGGWWRTNLNLMLTMLLGGLWHGASWSFLLWGGLHGAFLIANRLWVLTPLRQRLASLTGFPALLWRVACVVLTFHCVCLAWCFFRLTVLSRA
jgi:D-alanyl-lipoteichoic acid acyltransferase DltB (MBOAT superfamily)